jgi:hypothetical protein
MDTINTYLEIKAVYPPMKHCFFAFNNQQFADGKAQSGILHDEKIYHVGSGLYGTKNGLEAYMRGIDENLARIPKECNPQDVYEYEFDNHECRFIHDDTAAIKLVTSYFGEDIAKTVKRHGGCICTNINDLFNDRL